MQSSTTTNLTVNLTLGYSGKQLGNVKPGSCSKNSVLRALGLTLLSVVLLLLLFAVIRWQTTLLYLGNFLVLSEAPRPADLIVVLAGDFYGPRVFQGTALVNHGFAPRMLISGAPYQGRPEGEFAISYLAEHGYRTDLIDSFGHHAGSTIEEAIALRPELERRRAKRVILVTSAYHSRRASIVFRIICPDIQFISVPAHDSHYQPRRWWHDESSRALFFSEWRKIAGSFFIAYPQYVLSK